MHRPIILLIRKKTLVPSIRQIRHQYRNDWKLRWKVSYEQSAEIFFEIGGGPIKNDAQFAALILKDFGPGEYSILDCKKGRKGFRSFMHFIVKSDGYFQQVKAVVYRNKRKENLEVEYAKAKFDYQESKSEYNWDEMQSLQRKLERADHAQGPYPILESLQPRYREHKIEGWEGFNEIEVEETEKQEEPNNEETIQETGFWSTPIEQEYIEQEEDKPPEFSLW
jgi:hypothetical protein